MKRYFLSMASVFFLSNTSLAANEDLDFLVGSYEGETNNESRPSEKCSVTVELSNVYFLITINAPGKVMDLAFPLQDVITAVQRNASPAEFNFTFSNSVKKMDLSATVNWSKIGDSTEIGLKNIIGKESDIYVDVATKHKTLECLNMYKRL